MFSLCFPLIPTQHLRFPCVFHRFQNKTLVFLAFSTASDATHVFSVRFQQIQNKNMCFPCVFVSYVPMPNMCYPCVSTNSNAKHKCFPVILYRFQRKTCSFLCISTCLYSTHHFHFVFPQVPKQNQCFPCVMHLFQRRTYVFFNFSICFNAKPMFSYVFCMLKQNLCFHCVFNRFQCKCCVFIAFRINTNAKHLFSLLCF